MSPSARPDVQDLLRQSRLALQQGRRTEARRLAVQAAQLAPQLEDPWLLLAAMASPQASLDYLRRALEINPNSLRARQGLQWALERTRSAEDDTARILPARPVEPPPAPADTHPVRVRPALRSAPRWMRPVLWVIGLLIVALMAFIFIPREPAVARSSAAARPANALVKESLTPTPTLTFTPTSMPTQTPTSTPTHTPKPTKKPTRTKEPTDTPEPVPEQEEVAPPPDIGDISGHWIDVDLSDQMVYAYDGSELVNSFVVSTGTWQHPTVTGQYTIYVKYTYADMSGPGYYLPDVPYVMYFYRGYGLHGTYWHNNFGTPMSHGCVNLRTEDAGWLFDFADVGTMVNVHE